MDFLSADCYNFEWYLLQKEVKNVASRQLVQLFFTTLFIGGVTTGVAGFFIRWNDFRTLFEQMDVVGILSTFLWLMGMGFIFSVVSQMGFFAYLTIHRFGLALFRSFWKVVQVVLIILALFDLVYFRYQTFASQGDSVTPYLMLAFLVLIIGLVVSILKSMQVGKVAFIPALFFMVVVTVVEWIPVLRINDTHWLFLMLVPLVVCNTYQLLILHKINKKSSIKKEADVTGSSF